MINVQDKISMIQVCKEEIPEHLKSTLKACREFEDLSEHSKDWIVGFGTLEEMEENMEEPFLTELLEEMKKDGNVCYVMFI